MNYQWLAKIVENAGRSVIIIIIVMIIIIIIMMIILKAHFILIS